MNNEVIGEIVRQQESDFTRGNTQISKYVNHSMHDTLETIDAYLNSKHTSGSTDSLDREKPFFNVVTSSANIWYRATDIDRKDIRVKATKPKDWMDSFLATVLLRDWMRKQKFGQFLNRWGLTLARYGSAVVKFVENEDGLHASVVPWNRLIVDPVDFDAAPKIEIIELTDSQLEERIETHGYDEKSVRALIEAQEQTRETKDGNKKDNRADYIKLYEVHGRLTDYSITGDTKDDDKKHHQRMAVVSFVGTKKGRKTEYQDFILYEGKEDRDPYMITHLLEQDGRTLSIGAVEHLFEAQWMNNHSMKAIKDTLDVSSKLVFQTSDTHFVGRNVLTQIESGDILRHEPGEPLTQVSTAKPDIVEWQNYAIQWKQLGNEIAGISEAMLGAAPKSGTAWRQTEALLKESHNLFGEMKENKALYLEDMLRERIIPRLKKKINTSKEVGSILQAHEIERIDRDWIKQEAIKKTNEQNKERILSGEEPLDAQALLAENTQVLRDSLSTLGNQRFFKPSELSDKTWKEQFKDLEWDLEVDITGEAFDNDMALTTLNTALQLVVQPGFEQNDRAKMIVGKILELTGAMSPVEYSSIPSQPQMQQQGQQQAGRVPKVGQLSANNQQ